MRSKVRFAEEMAPRMQEEIVVQMPKFRGSCRAQSLVEFALCFAVFMCLIMAIMDFARMFYIQQTIQHAVREAGRVGIVGATTYRGETFSNPTQTVLRVLETQSAGLIPSPRARVILSNRDNGPGSIGLANSTFTIRVEYDYDHIAPFEPFVRALISRGSQVIEPRRTLVASSTFIAEKYNDEF